MSKICTWSAGCKNKAETGIVEGILIMEGKKLFTGGLYDLCRTHQEEIINILGKKKDG